LRSIHCPRFNQPLIGQDTSENPFGCSSQLFYCLPPVLAMVVNAMQQLDYVFVSDAVKDLGTLAAAAQNAFVSHHIEVLAGNCLLAAGGPDDITDTFFAVFKGLNYPQPDRMAHGLQDLSDMLCYLLIHSKTSKDRRNPSKNPQIALAYYHIPDLLSLPPNVRKGVRVF
jgi:hypothetical protein